MKFSGGLAPWTPTRALPKVLTSLTLLTVTYLFFSRLTLRVWWHVFTFQNSFILEVGLSDFHKTIVTVMKTTFQKLKRKIVLCRDYGKFFIDFFCKKLLKNLWMEDITNSNGLERFPQLCISTLDQFSLKKR